MQHPIKMLPQLLWKYDNVNVLYSSSGQTLDGSRWKYIGLESELLH